MAKPRPATKVDIEVLQRARDILDSAAKWNRHDDQNCETQTNTVSLYCAIKRASKEVPGNSGGVMQEARAAISEMDPKELKYKTRLTDYNNDPAVTFADLQKFFEEIEARLTRRMGCGGTVGSAPANASLRGRDSAIGYLFPRTGKLPGHLDPKSGDGTKRRAYQQPAKDKSLRFPDENTLLPPETPLPIQALGTQPLLRF